MGEKIDEDLPCPRPTQRLKHMNWYVYLIECTNGSLYTGISNDVLARYDAHRSGRGARYTRANPPKQLVLVIEYPSRSEAAKAEYRIKQLPSAEKWALCQQHPSSLANYSV